MWTGRRTAKPLLRGLPWIAPLLALLYCGPPAPAAGAENTRRVLVLYPTAEGQPGSVLFDQGLRSAFKTSSAGHVELYNEYLDSARFPDDQHQRQLAHYLRQKYAGLKIDVVVPGLAPALDFALKYRDEIFPGVPIVFGAIDQRELEGRELGSGVVGLPMRMDLVPTLELALRLHPNTRRVVVITGAAKMDAFWEAEARQSFRGYEGKLELVYLAGLPMNDLLREVSALPDGSIVLYLHVMRDGSGDAFTPTEVAERVAAVANAPVYGHIDSYLGRGIVGGSLLSFEAEGKNAALLASLVLAGERPENIRVPRASENAFMFDWRQLRRWGISEADLPPGSVVRFRQPTFWDVYRWHIIGVISLCVIEALLICGLWLQRVYRRRAETGLRESQRELRALTGRLLQAQETERRRIARELHDDLNQSLALLAVELDLLGQAPPESAAGLGGRLHDLSARVKQLSSDVHDLSHNLHPSKLEQLGLVAGVRGLCNEQAQAHGLEVEFAHKQMPPSIPDDTVLCLYRIAQEALHNVIKHSGARHARVELTGSEDGVSLRVVDDGIGFDPPAVDGDWGLGLASMRERLRLVGGTIVIDSRPSAGTRIDVHVPLCAAGQGPNAQPGKPVRAQPAGI
jgi:signal transduction histidine kinase